MAEKKSDKKFFIGLGVLFVFLAVMYGMSLGPLPEPEGTETAEAEVTEAEASDVEQAYNEEAAVEVETAETLEELLADPSFDLAAAKTERILGDTSAPIKITEHSSFSCGHCGKFHRETFKAFKEAYIDTGKAYLVFSDFPLNAPALHATKASRCVPEDRYFDFVDALFADQENWAFEPNYLSLLQNKAAEFGLDKEGFDACLQNKELQDALLARMKAVQGQWEIRSTPSFVVNNQVVVTGALAFDKFDEAIQDAVKQIEAENVEPSTSEEAE